MKKELRKLEEKLAVATKKRDYVTILNIKKEITLLKAKDHCVLEAERVDMIDIFSKMPRELGEAMVANMNSIALFIDWIEILTMRVDSSIQLIAPGTALRHYDKILALGKEAKRQCNFMFEKTSAEYQQAIADNSDDLLDRTLAEVKVLIARM